MQHSARQISGRNTRCAPKLLVTSYLVHMDADIHTVDHHRVITMDIKLAVKLVKYFFSGVVRSVSDDIISPFYRTENIGAFRSVQNSWALDSNNFFVRIGANN